MAVGCDMNSTMANVITRLEKDYASAVIRALLSRDVRGEAQE